MTEREKIQAVLRAGMNPYPQAEGVASVAIHESDVDRAYAKAVEVGLIAKAVCTEHAK